jgi:excinuclease ABC subunit C
MTTRPRRHAAQHDESAVLGAFIAQFYDNKTAPPMILLNHPVADKALIEEALGLRADRRVRLVTPRRGAKHALVRHAALNARDALARRLAESASQRKVLEGVADLFGLEAPPERIEVYDNSHISGTHPVGAMIVAGPDGVAKNAYRKFNIKSANLEPGDDYAMMREVLTRRFTRLMKEDEARDKGLWPDLVLIDGGPGQLSAVSGVFDELGVRDVAVAAIAKGPDRNAGRERLYLPNGAPRLLNPRDPVLYFLQRLRDEAHRFAIGTHRARRAQSTGRSMLDQVPGIGARRKKALLHHFGSAKAVGQAGLADLERVSGISTAIARTIYDHFHPEG